MFLIPYHRDEVIVNCLLFVSVGYRLIYYQTDITWLSVS